VAPEKQLTSVSSMNNTCIDVFKLAVTGSPVEQGWAGAPVAGGWSYAGFIEQKDGGALICSLALENSGAGLIVAVHTRLDGSDFIVRWLTIENIVDNSIALTEVMPYCGCVWRRRFNTGLQAVYPLKAEFPDSGRPYEIAYNHMTGALKEGDFYFEPVNAGNFRVASDNGNSGWSRPACWLRDRLTGETLVCEYAWSGNWEFQTTMSAGDVDKLHFEIGMLKTNGEVLRVLRPGEEAETPRVHIGLFRESDDAIVQATHRHVRSNILPALPRPAPVSEIEANHRGYLSDRESVEGICGDMDVAKAAGAELYVVDAGWYGREPNHWYDNSGDWHPGPWFFGDFGSVPEHAHKLGMRFGLWVEIESAGSNSSLREEHPEWLMTRHGAPCAFGRALNLADPAVEKFCLDTICGLVETYSLDMFRIDHNRAIGLGGTQVADGYVENTLWRYYEAFYRIFRAVRGRYPDLVLQNCCGGGGRLDWGALGLFHNTELSDWSRQPRGIKILSGVTMSLPPEILLRTVGTEVGEMGMDGDLDSQFRLCMISRPIYRGIAPAPDEFSPYLKEKFLRYNGLYASFFRPLLEGCLVYHHTPYQPICEPSERTVLEYASPDQSRGMIAIFSQQSTNFNVRPRGVSIAKRYRVTFDNSGESALISGIDLKQRGLYVDIGQAMSSELIMIAEAT